MNLISIFMMAMISTTWGEKEYICPSCDNTENHPVIMSYGGYIYGWPSKRFLIFWPKTDEKYFYTCSKCSFSSLMDDYDEFKLDQGQKDNIKQFIVKKKSENQDYPKTVLQKIEICEFVYTETKRSDNKFWRDFHKLRWYWLNDHKSIDKVNIELSIKNALAFSELVVKEKDVDKESLVNHAKILKANSMKDDASRYFDMARGIKYKGEDDESTKNGEEYLNKLIEEIRRD